MLDEFGNTFALTFPQRLTSLDYRSGLNSPPPPAYASTVRGWPKYTFMPGDANVLLASTSAVKPKRVKTYGGTK